MKNNFFYLFSILLFCGITLNAQEDSTVTVLDEVILTDSNLKKFSTGQQLISLSDAVLKQNRPQLTSVLQFNTPIYFKENGLGMVSSASFRGTTASQTAVLWNGININSKFNGQTDFNTINAGAFDEIVVRGGGGSVVYGTGAIGGTVHLNTGLAFRNKVENNLFVSYGSFHTLDARYNLEASTNKWSVDFSLVRNSSDNDYAYPDEGRFNENGQYENTGANLGFAYKLNQTNRLKFFSQIYDGERHFSLIRSSETKTRYEDFNFRNLLEWELYAGKFTSISRFAFLAEEYKYFGNIAVDNFTFGNAQTFIAKHQLDYRASETLEFSSIFSNDHTNGKGSGIEENARNIFSGALMMKHQATQRLEYELALRKELTETYDSPLLYSVGFNYAVSNFYKINFNLSRNFRIPTYNDLYWSTGGNPDLEPETSFQAEVGNVWVQKNWRFSATAYYIDISNMIHWVPGSDGLWRPKNEEKVHSYGLETLFDWEKDWSGDGELSFDATYAYTISENQEAGKQLIYVPYHKATASVAYEYKRFLIDSQMLFNGEVHTRSDNDPVYNLDAYAVANFGIGYSFGEEGSYKLGARVLNAFNEEYQNVQDRWMPGINYNIYLNLNF